MENAVRVVDHKSRYSLAFSYLTHHDADELAAIAALRQQFRRDLPAVHTGAPEALALHPGFDDFSPIVRILDGPEVGDQSFVNGKVSAINGKATGRQQSIVQKIRSGPMTAHHENRTPLSLRVNRIALCGDAALISSIHEI